MLRQYTTRKQECQITDERCNRPARHVVQKRPESANTTRMPISPTPHTSIVGRQPFPGPGLAGRIVGEVTEERVRVLQEADSIIRQEIEHNPSFKDVWQSFAVLIPVKTVGVMGDERTYANVIGLRIVESEDAMTADWARIPYEVLDRLSRRIINEVPGVNRVVYDISSKPPSTIEWE